MDGFEEWETSESLEERVVREELDEGSLAASLEGWLGGRLPSEERDESVDEDRSCKSASALSHSADNGDSELELELSKCISGECCAKLSRIASSLGLENSMLLSGKNE